ADVLISVIRHLVHLDPEALPVCIVETEHPRLIMPSGDVLAMLLALELHAVSDERDDGGLGSACTDAEPARPIAVEAVIPRLEACGVSWTDWRLRPLRLGGHGGG